MPRRLFVRAALRSAGIAGPAILAAGRRLSDAVRGGVTQRRLPPGVQGSAAAADHHPGVAEQSRPAGIGGEYRASARRIPHPARGPAAGDRRHRPGELSRRQRIKCEQRRRDGLGRREAELFGRCWRQRLRDRSVRPRAIAEPRGAGPVFRHRSRRARDPVDAGERRSDGMANLCRGQELAQDRRRHRGERHPEREADSAAARWRHRAAHRLASGANCAGYRAIRCRPAEDSAGAGCQRAATAGRRAGRSGVAARIDRAGRADDGRRAGRARFVDPVPPPRRGRGRISAARG